MPLILAARASLSKAPVHLLFWTRKEAWRTGQGALRICSLLLALWVSGVGVGQIVLRRFWKWERGYWGVDVGVDVDVLVYMVDGWARIGGKVWRQPGEGM